MGMGDVARQLELMAATRDAAPDFSAAWSEIHRREDAQAVARTGMPSMSWVGEFDPMQGAVAPMNHLLQQPNSKSKRHSCALAGK